MRIGRMAAVLGLLLATAGSARADDDGDIGFDPRLVYDIPVDGAPALGPADAPVTIVEYSDFYCRYCRRAAATLADLQLLYGDKLRLVYHHNLLDPEDGSLPAEASLAARAQGRFWPFHDRLFAADAAPSREVMEGYARELGLDLARFRRDLDGHRHLGELRDELIAAARLGVSGTPMFFINGRPLSGAQPIGVFVDTIDRELAAADAVVASGVAPAEVYRHITASGSSTAGPLSDDADEIGPSELDPSRTYAVGLGLPSQRRGADDALVTVVEFSDFRCGYCARVEPTLAALRRKYGADLRLVQRFFPLGGSAESRFIAEAALAAGDQGKFWDYHDRLFAADQLDRATLERIAGDLGLDVARLSAALDQRRFMATVARDAAEGSRLGVRGTPTFFINGVPFIGAQPPAAFEQAIDAELAKARALVKRGVPRAEVYDTLTHGRAGTAVGPSGR
jgi:protein-disulfide isomerase